MHTTLSAVAVVAAATAVVVEGGGCHRLDGVLSPSQWHGMALFKIGY